MLLYEFMIKRFYFPTQQKFSTSQNQFDGIDEKSQDEQEEPLPIEITSSEITADGKITLLFSENLKNLEQLDLNLKVMNAIRYQILDIKYKTYVQESDDGKSQKLPWLENWDILSFSSSQMIIQLTFKNPIYVSTSTKQDSVEIRVKNNKFFVSQKTDQTLEP